MNKVLFVCLISPWPRDRRAGLQLSWAERVSIWSKEKIYWTDGNSPCIMHQADIHFMGRLMKVKSYKRYFDFSSYAKLLDSWVNVFLFALLWFIVTCSLFLFEVFNSTWRHLWSGHLGMNSAQLATPHYTIKHIEELAPSSCICCSPTVSMCST